MSAHRIAIVASTPGQGKTTLGRELAARLGVRFVELDSWVHGPNWTELPTPELLARLTPVFAEPGWVIDGTFEHKLGTLVPEHAGLVLWLDLPLRIWFPRLSRRTLRRVLLREELWNGNRETWRDAIGHSDALILFAFRAQRRRRAAWPLVLAPYPTVRLRSPREVRAFLERVSPTGE